MGHPAITEPRWIAEIKARSPRLFRDMPKGPYGFDCGEGWKGILTRLLEKLEALSLPRLKIVQIKQKFGELRVYVEGGDEDVFRLIREAEGAAIVVCESCGAPGSKTNEGRILTLCPSCLLLRKQEREDQ